MSDVGQGMSLDYDFEDLLDSFEKKFAKKLAERTPPAEETQVALRPPERLPELDASDFPEELSLLLAEVQRLARFNRRKNGLGEDAGSERMDEGIGREVMRAEIRSAMTQLKAVEESASVFGDFASASSSQQTTVASLKRRLRELSEEVEQVRKQKKQADVQIRSLKEVQETHQGRVRMLAEKESLLQTERGEQDARLRELESSSYHLAADKKRLEKNVAMLRTELLQSHHKVSEQKLKTTQVERRVVDLEARAAELRSSESALADRVKELHEVQGQMLTEMKKVVDAKDAPAARRALANLTQQRSRIVGKIASILTKRGAGAGQSEGEPADARMPDPPLGASASAGDFTDGFNSRNRSATREVDLSLSSPAVGQGGQVEVEMQPSSDGALQKKSSLMALFRLGSSSTAGGAGLGRQRSAERAALIASPLSRSGRQQLYEASLVRSRQAAERDSDVLRDVVENKASEIERLEQELKDAKDQAAVFERELHSERQNRRKENRNLHVSAEDEAKKQMTSIVQQRNKPSTLFDWQGSASRQGGADTFAFGPGSGA
jgi:hypothetical protein